MVAAAGASALLGVGPFAGPEPYKLEVADKLADCREAGRDTGERCDPGADVTSTRLWSAGAGTLEAEFELTEAPALGPGPAWTVEFFIDAANGHTDGGLICGLSNVVDDRLPGPEAVPYALDPNTIPREPVDPDACDGRLEGSTVRFSIDVAGQPEAAPFRLIGLVRLEYPDDPVQPGSEDDFLVRTSLADLQRPNG